MSVAPFLPSSITFVAPTDRSNDDAVSPTTTFVTVSLGRLEFVIVHDLTSP